MEAYCSIVILQTINITNLYLNLANLIRFGRFGGHPSDLRPDES